MARMSIDDSVLRDPRVDDLAEAVGWSRRETLGALLDVWAVCYDRVSAVLRFKDVDRTARHAGFGAQMVTAGLAKTVRGDDSQVRICGVEDRIGYLEGARETGRKGGVKSGESRRRAREGTLQGSAKGAFENGEGSSNPSALPSASAPDVPSASVAASAPAKRKPTPTELPDDWAPSDKHREMAAKLGLDCGREAEQFADRNKAKGERYIDWNAAFRTWLRNAPTFQRQSSLRVVPANDERDRIRKIPDLGGRRS